MRKQIVLILTSVLATGAVANADQVNVTADPGKLIRIVELKKVPNSTATTSRTSLAVDEELQVYDNPNVGDTEHYTIDLEVLDEQDTLKQVAVCFYDSNALSNIVTDGTTEVATTCGSGFDDPVSIVNAHSEIETGNGVKRPQSAVQMAFVPSIYDESNSTKQPIGNPLEANTFSGNTVVYPAYQAMSQNKSLVSQKDEFNETVVGEAGQNNVWDLVFRFALKKFAHNSADWKIRVLATYTGENEGDPDQVFELIDTETYTVGYYGEIETDERESQDFEDVINGGSKEIPNIDTGKYYVNFASDIFIEASAFKDSSDNALVFDDNPTFSGDEFSPEAGKVSMKCVGNKDGSTDNQFMGAGDPKKLLADVPANSAEITAAAATALKVAPTHDCTLYIGDEVATGEYSNDVTVSIGKKDAGPPTD